MRRKPMNHPDLDALAVITARACQMRDDRRWFGVFHPIWFADAVEAYHFHVPLNLTALAYFDHAAFGADATGIWRHYDRKRDRIRGAWRPQSALEKQT